MIDAERGATCALCGATISDPYHSWCFGCRRFICDEHIFNPFGKHDPEDHDFVKEEQ